MPIFSKLYNQALDWAKSRYAIYWLSGVSFLESSILPYPPPDVILAPMSLKQPKRAYWFAWVCTITSVLGGLAGYFLGEVLLNFLVNYHLFEIGIIDEAKLQFEKYGIWFVGLAAFSPIPYKLATITAGMMHMALLPFIVISLLARGARYFLVAYIVKKYGQQCDAWLKKYIDRLGYFLIVLVALFLLYV